MQDRKKEIELELEMYCDLSKSVTDPLAVALMKEVVQDLQTELRQEQQQDDDLSS